MSFYSYDYYGDEVPAEIFHREPNKQVIQKVKDFFMKFFNYDIGEPAWRIGWNYG